MYVKCKIQHTSYLYNNTKNYVIVLSVQYARKSVYLCMVLFIGFWKHTA